MNWKKDSMETTPHSQPSVDKIKSGLPSNFQMIDVGEKTTTQRRAVAEGSALLSIAAYQAIKEGSNPKGNVLALAEVAGILMAKRTAELIPLCHPLPLDQVRLRFTLSDEAHSVTVFCEVSTHAKTGVEMEALAGVNGALLTIYDLSKAVDPVITLGQIRLNTKEGGKSGLWQHPNYAGSETAIQNSSSRIRIAAGISVITISDRVSVGKTKDTSGPFLIAQLVDHGGVLKSNYVVADEKHEIQRAVLRAIREDQATLIVTTGGTGLSPRDVTPEALLEIADRKFDGIGELLRHEGIKKTPFASLSRSLGVIIDQSLVIALPGSLKAVQEGFETLLPILPHALHILKGSNHD